MPRNVSPRRLRFDRVYCSGVIYEQRHWSSLVEVGLFCVNAMRTREFLWLVLGRCWIFIGYKETCVSFSIKLLWVSWIEFCHETALRQLQGVGLPWISCNSAASGFVVCCCIAIPGSCLNKIRWGDFISSKGNFFFDCFCLGVWKECNRLNFLIRL
jgi:hypothetical protein